jgi:hypothetical protein
MPTMVGTSPTRWTTTPARTAPIGMPAWARAVSAPKTRLSVRVGEPPAEVVDYDAAVAGSQTRCPLLVEVAGLGCAATAVLWADRRGLRGAWHRPN